jgi:molybdenum cofactor cytidylyltransferase
MEFGSFPLLACEGAILAHSQHAGRRRLKKGTVLDADVLAALEAAGVTHVTVARLGPDDVHEDAAAARVATACAGHGCTAGTAATGRVNLFADADGLVVYARAALDALNRIDESITVAAVAPYARVDAGQILATVKIIPFAAPSGAVARAETAARTAGGPLLRLAAFAPKAAGLIQTRLPGTPHKVLAKTERTLRARLEALGSHLVETRTVGHDTAELAAALAALSHNGHALVLVVGASATADRRDTIPAAVEAAGGEIVHFGMPVDPGNLLVLGRLRGMPVLALPGSARSPRTGGNDWVLQRLCADLPVTADALTGMGAGGLLKDAPERPLPRREAAPARPAEPGTGWRIGGIVLAAGESRRMGGSNKLLADLGGEPLIRRSVRTLTEGDVDPVIVVTGHMGEQVAAAVADLPVTLVANPGYSEGMGAAIRTGIGALPDGLDGVFVLPGDMPAVRAGTVGALMAAFDPPGGRTICVPENAGVRGHPVLFARRFFPELRACGGDVGARGVLREHAEDVAAVPVQDPGIALDLDTPAALAAYRGTAEQNGGAQP